MDKEEAEKSVDCVTDQEREYAQNALNEFNETSYANCLQNINKLENRTYDFKVAHNKAVVEYYKSDSKKTDQFQKTLNNIFNQFQMKLEKLDDVDHCVCHFNQAVLLYHHRQYTAALRIMDRVYKFIEPMDDNLSKQVGLLMIELQLCIRQPEKALGLITHLQNRVLNGTTNIKINLKHSKITEKEPSKDKLNKVGVTPPLLNAATELFLGKLAKYRAKCYMMNHTINLAKKEIQDFGNVDKTVSALL
ncbi:ccr4-not transcription complex subunit 10 [Holotrichia oblita]|uniref:Ccr4-not transcription complex subunit 10 n=1 Tax=Holotrichia oblita TaxID=644536 RepID=A0ACB9TIN3_HOLOL|nr:ccr4-not transcription complex subunit 10 [Holotrichia oblita]